MQMEQVANLGCLERLGFAIRVAKARDPSAAIQAAIGKLVNDEDAKRKARQFVQRIAHWDGPKAATDILLKRYGGDLAPSPRANEDRRQS